VFTGSSTLPGVGVPMVLVSGKLAAERVDQYAGTRMPGEAAIAPGAQPTPTPTTQLLPEGPVTLDESYALCREFNKRHGTTYYWSTKVLPKIKQHHVHALYAFARYADDIVDEIPSQGGRDVPTEVRAAALADFGDRFFADLDAGRSDDPVLKAVVHTVRAFDIDPDGFRRFLRSMTMDLTVESYATWDDLLDYMDGSAAVIGEMMLPILEPTDYDTALPHARDLGNAFQLTNFLRDIDEDLDRGRSTCLVRTPTASASISPSARSRPSSSR
jgi:15-cis-phytoene synthase